MVLQRGLRDSCGDDARCSRRSSSLPRRSDGRGGFAARGQKVVLIDRNPLVGLRLPPHRDGLELRRHDLDAPLDVGHKFEAVFFDAPWYPEAEELWLWQASRAVRPGGTIVFSLLPPLVRPTAHDDRADILREAAALGQVTVGDGVLRYDTPRFEAEALAAAGLSILPAWRAADLVQVDDVRALAPRTPPSVDAQDIWDTWVVGPQVVKLRRHTRGSEHVLSPVPGTERWIYTSVSRRDPNRIFIDLWTSRNRVARVGDRRKVARSLDDLARAGHTAPAEGIARELASILCTT